MLPPARREDSPSAPSHAPRAGTCADIHWSTHHRGTRHHRRRVGLQPRRPALRIASAASFAFVFTAAVARSPPARAAPPPTPARPQVLHHLGQMTLQQPTRWKPPARRPPGAARRSRPVRRRSCWRSDIITRVRVRRGRTLAGIALASELARRSDRCRRYFSAACGRRRGFSKSSEPLPLQNVTAASLWRENKRVRTVPSARPRSRDLRRVRSSISHRNHNARVSSGSLSLARASARATWSRRRDLRRRASTRGRARAPASSMADLRLADARK